MSKTDELHQQFSEYGKNAKEWLRKCSLMLPDIEKFEVWKEKGFNSIYEYAAKLACMSRGQVDDALRILRRIEDKPALLEVVAQKGLNTVRPVATVATKETAKFWAKKAIDLSRHELEEYVRSTKKESSDGDKEITINMRLKPATATKLQKFFNGDWNELMQKFIDLYEKNLQSELEAEKPLKKVSNSKYRPKSINSYVHKRSQGKCEFPNCTKPYKHLHHIDRFGSKREHDPDRIIALCEAHHKLAHRGLIDENENFKDWKLRETQDYTNLNKFIDDQVQFYRRA